jgi:FlaA1/EpsC-like NDP-sugar epimerase
LSDQRTRFFVCDIRSYDDLEPHFQDIDVVIHTAALKHVVLSERSPAQAVQTNIDGVQNVINAAKRRGVSRVMFTSSDKAVNPTNVMGTTKLMGERLITAANSSERSNRTIFASTRFGNVLGSRGSVVPIFKKQIAEGLPVTLTDTEMTRFVMSIEEAVHLVLDSCQQAIGGEVFVTKMAVVRICDLAQAMIEEFAPRYGRDPKDVELNVIGVKPGEKLYEELMSEEELRRAVELKDYFSVLPAFRGFHASKAYDYEGLSDRPVTEPYISANQTCLTIPQIRQLLSDYGLLEDVDSEAPTKRYWPGDKEAQTELAKL